MNPMLQAALLAILRGLLLVGAGWFVRKGWWTDVDAKEYVAAAAVALLTAGWSVWTRRREVIARMTALAMPRGATPADLRMTLKAGLAADPNTPHDVAPVIQPPTS